MPRKIKTTAAGKHTGLPDHKLAQLREQNCGPDYFMIAGTPYYSPDDLDVWLESCRRVPARRIDPSSDQAARR